MTINLRVDTKEEAAKTIQDIRKFDTVASVTVGSISESVAEGDSENSIVSFTLNITYTPVDMEEAISKSGDASINGMMMNNVSEENNNASEETTEEAVEEDQNTEETSEADEQ